ncbi:MAG TPA: DUF6491 family protein [Caulobacterales bacterium]|nr:DUF6491 family protein [Caulobacterales bacterium]
MHALTAGMCAAALLAFGVAKAGEGRAPAPPPGFVIVDSDARIPSTRSLTGFEVVDGEHVLIRAGVRDLYMAELSGPCARDARFNPAIAVTAVGPGGVDKFARVTVNGRSCAVLSLAKVERVRAPGRSGPSS